MTLLVVDPDDASSSVLADSLSATRFYRFANPGCSGGSRMGTHRRPELILCPYHPAHARPFGLAESILVHDPTLPVAIASHGELEKTTLLDALRIGVIDVLDVDHPDMNLAQQVDKAIGRGGRVTRVGMTSSAEDARTRAQLRNRARSTRRAVHPDGYAAAEPDGDRSVSLAAQAVPVVDAERRLRRLFPHHRPSLCLLYGRCIRAWRVRRRSSQRR